MNRSKSPLSPRSIPVRGVSILVLLDESLEDVGDQTRIIILPVSILVLLDESLEDELVQRRNRVREVSILVLLDESLEDLIEPERIDMNIVSILVLLDESLEDGFLMREVPCFVFQSLFSWMNRSKHGWHYPL